MSDILRQSFLGILKMRHNDRLLEHIFANMQGPTRLDEVESTLL